MSYHCKGILCLEKISTTYDANKKKGIIKQFWLFVTPFAGKKKFFFIFLSCWHVILLVISVQRCSTTSFFRSNFLCIFFFILFQVQKEKFFRFSNIECSFQFLNCINLYRSIDELLITRLLYGERLPVYILFQGVYSIILYFCSSYFGCTTSNILVWKHFILQISYITQSLEWSISKLDCSSIVFQFFIRITLYKIPTKNSIFS